MKPSNTASSIRVLSPGNDGDVSQSNDATAVGIAANLNKTDQSIEQSQGGSSAPSDARKPDEKSYGGSSYTQVAGQDASNHQDADADATAVQVKPTNTASSIRVLSPGNGGRRLAVEQHHRDRGGAERQQDGPVDRAEPAAVRPPRADARKPDEKSGHGSEYTQIAGQAASNHQERRRGCDGGPGEAVQHGVVDPRAEPGQRR